MKLQQLIGLRGVAPDENSTARFYGHLLEFPMMMAALWITALWYLSSVDESYQLNRSYDIGLWSLFLFETGLLALLVNNKRAYLKSNWLNLVIIALGLPLIWGFPSIGGALRLLRVMILLSLIFHVSSSVGPLFSGKRLGPTLLGSTIIIIMAGVMIAAIDPSIKTPADGVWWAWVTVTTVGYGDLVPTSSVGRIFGAILILVGIALISLITASVAAWFLSEKEDEIATSEQETISRIKQLEKQLNGLEAKLDKALAQKPNHD